MATFSAEALSGSRSSTPLSRRSTTSTPRSATPLRPARASSPQRISMRSSSSSLKRSNTPQMILAIGSSGQAPRSSTPQRSMKLDQAISAHRPSTPQRGVKPPRGMPQRRASGVPSALQQSSDSAKQSLMRRLAADAPHLRSTLASQPTLLGAASHLFEDAHSQSPFPVTLKGGCGDIKSATSLLAHTPNASSANQSAHHSSFPSTPRQGTSPSSRSSSPTKAVHSIISSSNKSSTVVKSSSAECVAGIEIKVGCGRAPTFTEEKARLLRQKMRETESYHDSMYHSGLASRLA